MDLLRGEAAQTVRRAIVVADDFGLSPGVNRGIVEAYERGIVTTATLLANMPGFDDAVHRLKKHPGLASGVHICLTLGRPVSHPGDVPTLLRQDGDFLGFASWLRRWLRRRISPHDVIRECAAQAQRLIDADLSPTHCDVHQHLDALPIVREAAIETCRTFHLPAVRPLREQPTVSDLMALNLPGPRIIAWPKRLAKFLAMRIPAADAVRAYARAGLAMPDRCIGLFIGGGQGLAGYRRIFERLPTGISEVSVHPAYVDEGLRNTPFKFVEQRETELSALVDPELRMCIKEQGIELVTYEYVTSNA